MMMKPCISTPNIVTVKNRIHQQVLRARTDRAARADVAIGGE